MTLFLIWRLHPLDNTYWIDICQRDGNMLATCGYDKYVRIFDKRESRIVRTFYDIHEGNIFWFNKPLLTSNY